MSQIIPAALTTENRVRLASSTSTDKTATGWFGVLFEFTYHEPTADGIFMSTIASGVANGLYLEKSGSNINFRFRTSGQNSGRTLVTGAVDGTTYRTLLTFDAATGALAMYVDSDTAAVTETLTGQTVYSNGVQTVLIGSLVDDEDLGWNTYAHWITSGAPLPTSADITAIFAAANLSVATLTGLTNSPELAHIPTGDGSSYTASIAADIGSIAFSHLQGPVDTDNFPYATSAPSSAPTINSVAYAGIPDVVALDGTNSIVMSSTAGTTGVQVNGIVATNYTINDANNATFDLGLGVNANYLDEVDVVVLATQNSAAYPVTLTVPSGKTAIALTDDYANLPADSPLANNAYFSPVVSGTVMTYDNYQGDLVFDYKGRVTITLNNVAGANIQADDVLSVELFFLWANNSYAGDTAKTILPIAAPVLPTIVGSLTPAINENTTLVATYAITDRNSELPTLTGPDASKLSINLASGDNFDLVFDPDDPDYEIPADAGADNVWNVTINIDNLVGAAVTADVAISIANVLEQSITDQGPLAIEIPYGVAGLDKTDSRVTDWYASWTDADSNNSASLPTTLLVSNGAYTVTFTKADAADVIQTITITEAAAAAPGWSDLTPTIIAVDGNNSITLPIPTGDDLDPVVLGGADAGLFSLSGNVATLLSGVFDSGTKASYALTQTASSIHGVDAVQVLAVNVLAVTENDHPFKKKPTKTIVENSTCFPTIY
jgi:hypothetical protein